ncbi:MAG: histidine phosphatase family protein [Candidatus Sungbacteria bacterium]|nr:histidine phosphatase family protein [Candidatus Sungbacteria bacterium]
MHRLKILLVRHGLSAWNEEQRHQGHCWHEPGLSEQGRKQADRLGVYLKDEPIIAIWTSPLPRTRQTSAIIHQYQLRAKTIPLLLDSGLMEISHGIADGMLFTEIKEQLAEGWEKMRNRVWHEPLFPGGESPAAASKRMLQTKFAIARIASVFKKNSRIQDGIIVVVAHGAVNNFFLCEITDTPLDQGWEKFPQDNCCINTVIWDDREGKFEIESVNKTDHLGDLKYTPIIEA